MEQAVLIGTPDSLISRSPITESPTIKYEPEPIIEFMLPESPPELNLGSNKIQQITEFRCTFDEMKTDLLRYVTLYIESPKVINTVKKILDNYSKMHLQKLIECK